MRDCDAKPQPATGGRKASGVLAPPGRRSRVTVTHTDQTTGSKTAAKMRQLADENKAATRAMLNEAFEANQPTHSIHICLWEEQLDPHLGVRLRPGAIFPLPVR